MVVIQNHLAMGFLNLMVLALLSYMVLRNDGLGRGRKSVFQGAILATGAVVLTEMYGVLFDGGLAASRTLYVVSNVAGFALAPVIPILLASVFGDTRARMTGLNLLPSVVNALLVALSPFFGFVFEIAADGAYRRGGLFGAFVASYLWSMLVMLRTILKTGRRYQYPMRAKLLAIFAFIILGTSIQVALPQIHTTWTCITLAMALYYGFVCEFNDTTDVLTKLYNRKSYEGEIERLRKRERYTVIVMDVDDFKRVNDLNGHPYGDQCLARLALLIKEAFYRIGVCYRIGGDEFCVLARTVDEKKILAAIGQLVRGIEARRAQDPALPVLSYGWRICAGTREGVSRIIEDADRQMYENKARHKGERK